MYIKREEALRQIFLEAMGHDFDFNAEYRNIYISAKRAIKNTPAADVAEVRHGRWITEDCDLLFAKRAECSVCGKGLTTTDIFDYCPNCGAKMDKGE